MHARAQEEEGEGRKSYIIFPVLCFELQIAAKNSLRGAFFKGRVAFLMKQRKDVEIGAKSRVNKVYFCLRAAASGGGLAFASSSGDEKRPKKCNKETMLTGVLRDKNPLLSRTVNRNHK